MQEDPVRHVDAPDHDRHHTVLQRGALDAAAHRAQHPGSDAAGAPGRGDPHQRPQSQRGSTRAAREIREAAAQGAAGTHDAERGSDTRQDDRCWYGQGRGAHVPGEL